MSKYVEMRTYRLTPGGHAEWYEHYRKHGMETQKRVLGNMVGYYHTEHGPLNEIVHMWGYDSLDDRVARRAALFQEPQWLEFVPKVRPLLESMESKVLVPAPFFTPDRES